MQGSIDISALVIICRKEITQLKSKLKLTDKLVATQKCVKYKKNKGCLN